MGDTFQLGKTANIRPRAEPSQDMIKTICDDISHTGQNNTSFWCRSCSVEFDPESENLRRESKITVPDRNIQPAVTSIQTNMADEVEIRHTVPKRGGFAELEKKGLKIKNYHTTEKE
jgi:hypothetical protein